MAGFLETLFGSPDQTMALGLLGANMMAGNAPQGFLAAQQYLAGADDRKLKRGLLEAQIAETKAQAEARKMTAEKQTQLMDMAKRIALGAGAAPAAPGQLGSGSFGIVPAPAGMPDIPAPRPSGIGGANYDDIVAFHAMGGPDLTNAYKFAREGIERKPGSFYEDLQGRRQYIGDPVKGIGFENGRVTVMPGAPEAQAALAGATATATERAKAGNQLLPLDYVDTGTGRPIGGSVLSYLDGRPMPNKSGGTLTPELSRAIREDAAKNGIPNPVADFTSVGVQNPVYGLSGASGGPSGALQSKSETAGASAAAEAAARLPFQTTDKVNESWLKTSYEPTVTAGGAANDMLTSVQVARQAMRNMGGTGWGTEAQAMGANVLAGLGMAPDSAKQFAANAQTFQSASMTTLWTRLNAAKGPQTEGDATRAQKTWAQLQNRPEANEFILDLSEATARRDQMKAAFYQQALPIARQKGDLQEVEREWLKRAPSIWSMPIMKRWERGIK